DRAQFALREEAGERYSAGRSTNRAGIMMRLGKQARAPTVAGKHQRSARTPLVGSDIRLQQRLQILVRGVGIANVELDRLTHPNVVGDREGAALALQSHDVADQEIAPLKLALVFIDDAAYVQPCLEQLAIVRAQLLPELLQPQ